MLLLLTSCRRKAARLGADLTSAEAVAMSWHETACERYAWTRIERIARSAEAWVWTMNGRYTPFEDHARAVANRCAGAIRCTAARTQTTASQAELSASTGGCLRVPPSLAATDSQEIGPVSGALASKGNAFTGIKRADTANEFQCDPARSKDIFCQWFAEQDGNPTGLISPNTL